MEAWRLAVREARRERDLEQRREALVLRRCFRGWRVLRARSTLTPQVRPRLLIETAVAFSSEGVQSIAELSSPWNPRFFPSPCLHT